MAVSKLNPSAGGIPFGNTAGRPTAATGKLYSNGETARLELYTQAGAWENIVQEVPGVASITGNYSEAANSGTIAIQGTNFVTGAIASAIGTNGVEVIASSTTYNSLVQLTAVFTGLSNANEPYDIKVTNPSNLFGLIPDALYVNASPVWTTSAGSLGTFAEQVSVSLSATATDSDSTIAYALASGSTLPSGLSLNSSSGLISGTLPNISSNTTYSFTVNASDGLNVIPRSFSITSLAVSTVSGGTLTSDSTYYYRTFSSNGNLVVSELNISGVDILAYAGGGAGGEQHGGGGGGAGGYVYSPNQTLSIGTYPVVVGSGGGEGTRSNGSNSRFGSLAEAIGGGAGAAEGQSDSIRARVGGSGGGGGGTFPSSYMTGAAGTSGQGNAGGSGVQTSTYGGGAGGGGAGSAGANNFGQGDEASRGGNGGSGLDTWSSWAPIIALGTSGFILGGGGGGAWAEITSYRGLGSAGGGNGAVDTEAYGASAVEGSGSGGGGSSGAGGVRNSVSARSGGAGGSGRVIVRYLKSAVGG
jgi:hypothetical protein